jgi:hypothetical protein
MLGSPFKAKVLCGTCRRCKGENIEAREPNACTMEIFCHDCNDVTYTVTRNPVVPCDDKVKDYSVTFVVGEPPKRLLKRGKEYSITTLRVTGDEFNQLMQEASHFLLIRAQELRGRNSR